MLKNTHSLPAWQLYVGVLLAILTPACTIAVTLGRYDEVFQQDQRDIRQLEAELERHKETTVDQLGRIDRNVVRLAARLNVQVEAPR